MKIGDFDVSYRGSDGSIIIRWKDPITKKHLAKIMDNPNDLFAGMLEKVFEDRTQVIAMFTIFQNDTINFLNSQDGYMLSPMHNPKLIDEKYTNLQERWRGTPEQIFEWDVASFVYAYNTYFNKKTDHKDVLPLVKHLQPSYNF